VKANSDDKNFSRTMAVKVFIQMKRKDRKSKYRQNVLIMATKTFDVYLSLLFWNGQDTGCFSK